VSNVKPCGILLVDLKGISYENGFEEKKHCHLKPRILKFFGGSNNTGHWVSKEGLIIKEETMLLKNVNKYTL
jgi:hypothetical protein